MNLYRFTKKDLSAFLKAMDTAVEGPVYMVIIGGSAITLAHDPENSTKDIDTLSDLSSLWAAYKNAKKATGINLALERVTVAETPYHYEDRLEDFTALKLKNIHIQIPEKHDLVLTNIARADTNDLQGIIRVHKASGINIDILITRFCAEMGHSYGSMQKLCINLLYVIYELFGAEQSERAETILRAKFPEAFK